MAKIRSLFNLLKRLLNSESKNKHERREKRRRWIFGRLKCKRLPVLVTVKERKVSEAEEEQSKHALTIATAAVAEAEVAAAQAAAEVVRLTRTNTLRDHLRNHKGSKDLAAIKIQTAYRGYLARKALRALKGLVRLQAIVRGQAVRRQAVTTLKGLQTIVRIQSQVRARRARPGSNPLLRQEKESGNKMETLLHVTSKRGWEDSLRLKEDIDATFIGRQEALIKKERVQEYLLSLGETRKAQQLQESEASKVNECLSHWLDEWVAAHEHKSRRDLVICSNIMQRNADGRMEVRLSELQNYGAKIAMSPPRRSFHKPNRRLLPNHNSLDSLVVPNYMSATESAMARLRSNSTRMRSPETYSDRGSPFKNKISFYSIDSDSTTTVMSRKAPISEQRSPIMKGLLSPIKLYPSAKDFH